MIKKNPVLFVLFTACVLAFSANSGADAAQKAAAEKRKTPPPPDYFPLRIRTKPQENDWWKYQSTTGEGKLSNFTMKVISAEKNADEQTIILVDTITQSKTIHDWYSKPKGLVIRHKEQFGEDQNLLVGYDPVYTYIKNPLVKGDTWQWSGKGLMGVTYRSPPRFLDRKTFSCQLESSPPRKW